MSEKSDAPTAQRVFSRCLCRRLFGNKRMVGGHRERRRSGGFLPRGNGALIAAPPLRKHGWASIIMVALVWAGSLEAAVQPTATRAPAVQALPRPWARDTSKDRGPHHPTQRRLERLRYRCAAIAVQAVPRQPQAHARASWLQPRNRPRWLASRSTPPCLPAVNALRVTS
jgi:hypothetical protein